MADDEIVLKHPDVDGELTFTRDYEDDPFWPSKLAQVAVYEKSGWKRQIKSKPSGGEK